METAHITDKSVTGTDVKMVGVGKLDLTVKLIVKLYGRYTALDCGAGTDVHKYGSLNIPVNGVKHASARSAVLC
jgi:hypothetical protein